MENLNEKTLADLSALARNGMGPQYVTQGNVPYVLVPQGYTAKAMPELIFNEHTATPERIKQDVSVLDPVSFVRYYNLFADENSRVFANEPVLNIVAILDYHGAKVGAPRWGEHQLTLALRESEEWKIWTAMNNKPFTQQAFAEFLEQNSSDVSTPMPSAMQEIASDLQATTEVEFGSGIRQQDGQVRFKYTETIKATVGAGSVDVPDRFTLSIPIFIGGDNVSMDALLRFRVNSGKLTFTYALIRPEQVKRTAFTNARNEIEKTLGIEIINGRPFE